MDIGTTLKGKWLSCSKSSTWTHSSILTGGTAGKRRKRSMPLRGFNSDTNIAAYLADLLQSPKHSKYLNIIPQKQLDSLFHRVKEAHCGVIIAPLSMPVSTPKVSSYRPSSLLDIPPILASSPNHTQLNKKKFDDQLDKLINFDGKDDSKINSDSDSFEDRLGSSEPGGAQKEVADVSRQFYSEENGKLQSAKLSDLPGLSSLRVNPKLDTGAEGSRNDDPLLSVLSGSDKQSFGVQPPSSTEEPGLGKLPPVGVASVYAQGSDVAQGLGERGDLDDESLAVDELLEDDEDDSLGLGLGEKVYTGVRLSASSSGDDLRRLNEIVTPPLTLDEPTLKGSLHQYTRDKGQISITPLSDEDLNKATDEHLAKRKEEMDILFDSNCLKPGDEGYVYDKEVDFDVGPKMESGWDSDDTMSDF